MDSDNKPWEDYKRGVKRAEGPPRTLSPARALGTEGKPKKGPSFRIKKKTNEAPEIDGKIDLHGRTQAEAFDAIGAFIAKQSARGAKRVLIVTGKGKEGQSVLRLNAPRWCEASPLSRFVASVEPACLSHGGDGAFYVVLKKTRKGEL